MSEERPRLRTVEAFPVEHGGQRVVGLRDPAGYTESVLLLPPALVEIVAMFDGEHTVVDMQAELMRRRGELVPRSQIEEVVGTLDEHGFLQSARFAAHRRALDRRFLDAPTRAAAHAAGAYPAEPGALRTSLDAWFHHPDGPGSIRWPEGPEPGPAASPVRGVIAPHIDFQRGGTAYAWAYRALAEGTDADLFVVIGTSHTGMRHPFALTRKHYETPLGPARVDEELVEAVATRAGQDCFGSELAHRAEHSIEFQAVMLRHLFGGRREFTIVPVLASFAHEAMHRGQRPDHDRRVPAFLDALGETLARSGRRAAVIAGADLAHIGPRFGDPEPVSAAGMAEMARADRAMLDTVERGDPEGFFGTVAADGDRRRICGLSPIYALLRVLGGGRGEVRRYGYWPDPQGVVSFASVVIG